ncbi:MAG: SMP-30/gluconolactonase/LRE family protein [Victivallales bacterium]
MRRDAPWQLFADSRCEVGEGPRWHETEQRLYWVDIPHGVLYRKSPDTPPEVFESFTPGIGKIGAFAFYQGELLLFGENCRIWKCRFGDTPELFAVLPNLEATRFNDVLADHAGHIYCGVAWDPKKGIQGSLWRFSPADRTFQLLQDNLNGMPNGMGISPDRKTFYFAVSEEHRLYAFAFDETAGLLNHRRTLLDFDPEMGNPDGIAVDPRNGGIAVAFWDGGQVRIYSSSGKQEKEYRFPVSKTTSVEYAPNGLFLTTGNRPWDEGEFIRNHAGGVWHIPFELLNMLKFS